MHLLEVAAEEAVLDDAIALELRFCVLLGIFVRYRAGIVQKRALIAGKIRIDALRPILHRHRNMAFCATLGKFKDSSHHTSQVLQFALLQVILCNADIGLHNLSVRGILPRCQSHMLLGGICTLYNQLGSRVLMDGIMHLVLYLLVKEAGSWSILVVVDARGVDVGELQIEATLAQADFPNLGKQVLEIILTDERTVLHTLAVQHITTEGNCLNM